MTINITELQNDSYLLRFFYIRIVKKLDFSKACVISHSRPKSRQINELNVKKIRAFEYLIKCRKMWFKYLYHNILSISLASE